MNPVLGWALAAVLVFFAWRSYGWQGVLLAVTAVVFWLLLQFNRTLRVMKNAGQVPVGHIDSAVMLNAKLRPGLTMLQVVTLTKSLGQRLDEAGDAWAWTDAGGSSLRLEFRAGKLASFVLQRPAPQPPPPGP